MSPILVKKTFFGTAYELPHRQVMSKAKAHVATLTFSTTSGSSVQQQKQKIQGLKKLRNLGHFLLGLVQPRATNTFHLKGFFSA